jgi:hypothetical protein
MIGRDGAQRTAVSYVRSTLDSLGPTVRWAVWPDVEKEVLSVGLDDCHQCSKNPTSVPECDRVPRACMGSRGDGGLCLLLLAEAVYRASLRGGIGDSCPRWQPT